MIAKLRGIIDQISEDYIIIDVSGVGYLVYCSSKVLNKLSNKGQTDEILIQTIVREDQITLYGFKEENEKYWFDLLLKVQGVGAKTAIKGLSKDTERAFPKLRPTDKQTIKPGPAVDAIASILEDVT